MAQVQVALAAVATGDVVDGRLEVGLGLFLLLSLPLGFVHIHEGEAHITLGHEERESTVHTKADGAQVALQQFDGLADVVAGSAKCPTKMTTRVLDVQATDKIPHQHGRAPTMNGEAESYALVFLYAVCTRFVCDGCDVVQGITCGLADLTGCPKGVARTR